jgi:putative effector of murein hydrolase
MPTLSEHLLRILFWSVITYACYRLSKRLYAVWPRWWLPPVAVSSALIGGLILLLHQNYRGYIQGTHWLVMLLNPATVAFAIPIYEKRALIRIHWPILLVGMIVGSITSVLTSWLLASALGLEDVLRLSLIPRSISTPFAMVVSGQIGGTPNLTAVFCVLTGVLGAVLGDFILERAPLRSVKSRGSLYGLGAHAVGTTRAMQIGKSEGAMAGLVMVLTGLLNVLVTPLVLLLLKH